MLKSSVHSNCQQSLPIFLCLGKWGKWLNSRIRSVPKNHPLAKSGIKRGSGTYMNRSYEFMKAWRFPWRFPWVFSIAMDYPKRISPWRYPPRFHDFPLGKFSNSGTGFPSGNPQKNIMASVFTRPGKRLHSYGKSPGFNGKINYFDWAMFNSYFTRGYHC